MLSLAFVIFPNKIHERFKVLHSLTQIAINTWFSNSIFHMFK